MLLPAAVIASSRASVRDMAGRGAGPAGSKNFAALSLPKEWSVFSEIRFCTRYNEGKCHIAKERRTYQIHKGTAASYVAAAVQIPGNRLVPDCCRRPADIVLPPKKFLVCPEIPRQCGHPWENRTKSPSGSHRFPVLTGDRFFRTKVLPDGSGCPSCPYGSKCRTGS